MLDALGPIKVDSHTVKIRVELKDTDALKAAVQAMNGTWIGQGEHRIFDGAYQGLGFRLPNWQKVLVLQPDGTLLFDDYQKRWGDPADIDKLKAEYSLACATNAAIANGWQCEREGMILRVTHPSGASLVVNGNGTAEAFGFQGSGCHEALTQLGIQGDFTAKAEFGQVACEVQTQS